MEKGWISLHRKILESDLWNDPMTFRLFIYLILNATHKDGVKVHGVELKKGQFIRSYRKLAEDLSYKEGRGLKKPSISTIRRCVQKLNKSNRVSFRETEVGTLFEVVNYALYQDFEGLGDVNPELKAERTQNEPRTKAERTQNKNNNGNNGNNGNKYNIPYVEIVEYLNKTANKKYRTSTQKTQSLIRARWNEGFRLEDFKNVIDKKVYEWKNDPKMSKYIRPETLFGTKFEGYLNQDKSLKVIQGGVQYAESSYTTDYSKYDFSKNRNMQWL